MKLVATVEVVRRPTMRTGRGVIRIWAPDYEHVLQAAGVASAAARAHTAGVEMRTADDGITVYLTVTRGEHNNIGGGARKEAVTGWTGDARDAAKAKLRELGYTVRRYLVDLGRRVRRAAGIRAMLGRV